MAKNVYFVIFMVEILRFCENLKTISTFSIHAISINRQSDLRKHPIYTIKIDLNVLKLIFTETYRCIQGKKCLFR